MEQSTYDFELLKTMYWIHSPSGSEEGLQGFIRQELYKKGIKFHIDDYNQTYNFDNTDRPLVVAHVDQVKHKPVSKVTEIDGIIRGDSNLGADDKNGIWIILNLLNEFPDLNFCFSNKEEVGGDIDSVLYYEKDLVDSIPYCLVFDRKGKGDIIGNWNGYCSEEFEDAVCDVGDKFGFRTTYGIFSDCDEISGYLNCVNISCGYYEAHSIREYTVKSEILNSLEFGKSIIERVKGPFEHTVQENSFGCFGSFGNYGSSYNSHKSYDTYDHTKSYNQQNNNQTKKTDYKDIYPQCPLCNCKMNPLTVYDKEYKGQIEYGERCSGCDYEEYYGSYSTKTNKYISYKPKERKEETEFNGY